MKTGYYGWIIFLCVVCIAVAEHHSSSSLCSSWGLIFWPLSFYCILRNFLNLLEVYLFVFFSLLDVWVLLFFLTFTHICSRFLLKMTLKLNLEILQVFVLYLAYPLFVSNANFALSRSVFTKTGMILWSQILFFASRAWPGMMPFLSPLFFRNFRLRQWIGIFL
jgi:hypothetical protein